MSACCNPHEYDAVFTSKYARKTAKKLRRSGLDETAGRMVDVLTNHGHLPVQTGQNALWQFTGTVRSIRQ